jgi:hypothetical protein
MTAFPFLTPKILMRHRMTCIHARLTSSFNWFLVPVGTSDNLAAAPEAAPVLSPCALRQRGNAIEFACTNRWRGATRLELVPKVLVLS